MVRPEDAARVEVDAVLQAAGWLVQDRREMNVDAGRGVAVREFPLRTGFGSADYMLYVDGAAVGVIEAKKAGVTLTGVEVQAEKYSVGLPDAVPALVRPLNQNLVMEYGHDQAVADQVNVDFDDVYKIRTRVTEQGATVEAGPESFVGRRERLTRRLRWEQLDEDLTYDAGRVPRRARRCSPPGALARRSRQRRPPP